MRRVYQIASLIFLAFSAYLVFKSRQMEYYADLGPGPGFFPFWLGALLAVLSIIWLVQVSMGPGGAEAAGLELRYMDATQLSAYWDQVDATLKPIIDDSKKK